MIIQSSDLKNFFRDEVATIIEKRKELISQSIILDERDRREFNLIAQFEYLISLLERYAIDGRYFRQGWTVAPMSDFLQLAQAGQLVEMNTFADFCLYRLGFFPFSFVTIDRPSFIQFGYSAYDLLGIKNFENKGGIFSFIAKNFIIYINIISEIGKKLGYDQATTEELSDLYYDTGNQIAFQTLFIRGKIPNPLLWRLRIRTRKK